MTYLNLLNHFKQIYSSTNDQLVLKQLIFFASKRVKNQEDFLYYRNQQIDFTILKYTKLVNRYFLRKEPLGSIIGLEQFYFRTFHVFKKMHVPRSDTEKLVEVVLENLKNFPKQTSSLKIFDLCCGTGNIGISLALETNAELYGWDISAVAIKNSIFNAINLNLKNFKFYHEDFKKAFDHELIHFVDVIVCNPPYVLENDLDQTMTKYENKISFYSKKNVPEKIYRVLIENIMWLIKARKPLLVAFEIDQRIKSIIDQLIDLFGLKQYASFYYDQANRLRVLVFKNY